MSMLNFEINRADRNLPAERHRVQNHAKAVPPESTSAVRRQTDRMSRHQRAQGQGRQEEGGRLRCKVVCFCVHAVDDSAGESTCAFALHKRSEQVQTRGPLKEPQSNSSLTRRQFLEGPAAALGNQFTEIGQ